MKILVHICCGPCSLTVFDWLHEHRHEATGFFFNPNIHPLAEYMRRRESAWQAAKAKNIPIVFADTLPFEDQCWSLESAGIYTQKQGEDKTLDSLPPAVHPVPWLRLMHLQEFDRCKACWSIRLQKTAEIAHKNGYDGITSTLLYSRYQNHALLQEQGERAAREYGLQFVYHDFRKFWGKGVQDSKELNLYRQPYCGCIYSEYARYSNQLQKLAATK